MWQRPGGQAEASLERMTMTNRTEKRMALRIVSDESSQRKTTKTTKHRSPEAARVLAAGRFLRDPDGGLHYVDGATGKTLALDSKDFRARVATIAGVPSKDKSFAGILSDIEDHAREHAELVRVEHCAAYDRERNRFLVNLGAGNVMEVTATAITSATNGDGAVLFIDEPGFEPVDPRSLEPYDRDPGRALKEVSANVFDFPPLVELERTEAVACSLAAWIGFFFDREFARAKPLPFFVGPIGSGKTVCSRKIGCIFYGRSFEVSVSASPDRGVKDLAAAVAHATITVRDDMNSAPPGLLELLLCVSTGAKFELSAFHRTLERATFAMRGSVIFTASKPKWAKREDLLSRLLPFRVTRDDSPRETEESEEDRLARAYRARAAAWYIVLDALGHVLASRERPPTLTRFRTWEQAARAALKPYGLHDALVSGLQKMKRARTDLALAADPFLAMLLSVATKYPGREWKAAELSDALATAAGMHAKERDPHVAPPRGSQELGKLLEHIEREGGAVVRVERVGKAHGNVAKWRLDPVDYPEGDGGSGGSEGDPISSKKKNRGDLSRNRRSQAPPTPPKAPGSTRRTAKLSPRSPRSPHSPRRESPRKATPR